MPNWVTNRLQFIGDKKEIIDILNEIAEEKESKDDIPKRVIGTIDFNKIIPMPDDIYQGDLGKAEYEKYGEKNWYDWSRNNWNTKWNATHFNYKDILNDDGYMLFDTAWNSPYPVIQELSRKHPDVVMILDYINEFNDFAGHHEFIDGKCTIKEEYWDEQKIAIAYRTIWGVEMYNDEDG